MNTRGLFVVAATAVALLLAAGCGSSDSSEVTVQTGSLSKAEFVKKANSICEAARTEFLAKYSSFVKAHESDIGNAQKEKELIGEMVESTLAPNVEGQIEQISELGAPDAYAPEVASFLNAAQKRLDELQRNPVEVSATPFPFKKAEAIAEKAGIQGCAESFS